MTAERAFVIGVEPTPYLEALVDDIWAAADRASKADPGDRSDVVRFESLATQLELRAAKSLVTRTEVPVQSAEDTMLFGADEGRWPDDLSADVRAAAAAVVGEELMPVLIVQTLVQGEFAQVGAAIAAEPPAERWESDGTVGRKALEERFRAQIDKALGAAASGTAPRSIAPSGISNHVITEILREYVEVAAATKRVDVPIEYRDGSRAACAFPLRALPLANRLHPAEWCLDFALLSIRHTEMDTIVHGAWLRNSEVSRLRPAGQTHDLVYELSRTQFCELTAQGRRRVRINMYQTGFETAVIGFYHALTDHLLEFPGSVALQPMYFQNRSRSRRKQRVGQQGGKLGSSGMAAKNRPGHARPPKLVIAGHAPFRKGTPWQM